MKKILIVLLAAIVSVVFGIQIGEADSGKHKHAHGEKGKHACYEKSGIHRGGYIHA